MFLILVATDVVSVAEGPDVENLFEDIVTRVLDAKLKIYFDQILEKIEDKFKDHRQIFNGMLNVTAVESASRNTEYHEKVFREKFPVLPFISLPQIQALNTLLDNREVCVSTVNMHILNQIFFNSNFDLK
jgi:hypothetical protein